MSVYGAWYEMTRCQLYRPSAEERKWLRQEVSRRLHAKLNYSVSERGQRSLDRSLRALGIDIPLSKTIKKRKSRAVNEKESKDG